VGAGSLEPELASLVTLLERIPDLYVDSWDAIVVYRLDGTIVAGNRAARAFVPDEVNLLGSHFFVHMSPDERVKAQTEFNAIIRNGEPRNFESVFALPGGRRINVDIRLLPARIDGVMVGVYGIARDVTSRKQFEREMHDSQQRLLSLFENHPDSIAILDVEGRYRTANRAAETLSGFSVEQYRGKTTGELFDPESPQHFAFLVDAISAGRPISYESSIIRADGKTIAVEGTTIPIRVDGVLQGAFNVLKDVTEKRHYDARLIRDSERMRHLYQIASSVGTTPRQRIQRALGDGIVQLNADWGFVARVREDEVTVEQSAGDGAPFHAGDKQKLKSSIIRHVVAADEPLVIGDLKSEPWNADVSRRHELWTGFAGVALHVANQFYGVAGFTTLTRQLHLETMDREYLAAVAALIASAIERDLQYQRLNDLAHQDPLTGLPNRALLLDRLDQTLLQSRRYNRVFALHFLDFDAFKQVNDQFGHAAGDELLIKAAFAMSKVLRESDTLARVGGDEFVVLQPEISGIADATRIRDRLIASVENPFSLEKTTVRIGVSVGTAVFPQDGSDAADLLEHADRALYRAKDEKRSGEELPQPHPVEPPPMTSYASLHHLICACGHTAFSHGARGCRVPKRVGGRLVSCRCHKTLEQIYAGSGHPRRRKNEVDHPLVES
jgi:diguanylate cyclase (GGDEF)-like protein/PAS domain S-box-containing protein